jgi:hypothetical protein
MHVVIRMALEIGQQAVGDDVIGIPSVHFAESFAFAAFGAALQAVMFDVIDHFQEKDGHGRLK